jgi:hypothetical protein
LQSQGFKVLRFWNSDIDANLTRGHGQHSECAERPPTRPAFGRPPCPRGGGIRKSPRQVRRPHQELVDRPRTQPPLADRPDHQ